MINVFINADDFGLKSSVNKAIIECFHNDIITSTTLMANMAGFDEAIELAHKNNIVNKTGIHLTLTEGYPVTREIRNSKLFYDENNSDLKKHKRNLFFMSSREKELVFNEFAAQIEKVKNSGIKITHIDTHHHIDEVWSITNIICTLLKTYNIPSMRILNNLNSSTRFHKIVYRRLVNNFIKSKGSNYSDLLGNQLEAISYFTKERLVLKNRRLEIMVHPDFNNNGLLIDKIGSKEYDFNYPEELRNYIYTQKVS